MKLEEGVKVLLRHLDEQEWRSAVFAEHGGNREDFHKIFIWRDDEIIKGIRVLPTVEYKQYNYRGPRVLYRASVGRIGLEEDAKHARMENPPDWVVEKLLEMYQRYDGLLSQNGM